MSVQDPEYLRKVPKCHVLWPVLVVPLSLLSPSDVRAQKQVLGGGGASRAAAGTGAVLRGKVSRSAGLWRLLKEIL